MVQARREVERHTGGALSGKQVAIAGRLASMTRGQAGELIASLGGETTRMPGRRTSFVVVGEEGGTAPAGGRIPQGLARAKELRNEGCALEVLSEQRFLELAGLSGDEADPEVRRLYTIPQLARILKVPGRTIRLWVRDALIRPARTLHGIDYFDFGQVTELRLLAELTGKGVEAREIRRSLEQARRWIPDAERSLVQLARAAEGGRIFVRLDGGHLAEPSGQLRIEFAESGEEQAAAAAGTSAKIIPARSPSSIRRPVEACDSFERAVELEASERLEEAAAAYEEAFLEEPSAETAFNLGNVLYALGRARHALARFRQAVELDCDFAEAWNNLASVHVELEQWEDAVEAGERALALAPDYLEAHYNLAQALNASGRRKEARRHGRIYLEHDPHSEWSRRLRLSLGLA
jgi:tetratricopeptide (TPR) repeat protein